MPKHEISRASSSTRIADDMPRLAGDRPSLSLQTPIYTRHHPYAPPPVNGVNDNAAATKPEIRKAARDRAKALLDTAAASPVIGALRPGPNEVLLHQDPFRQFLREAPDLDVELQTIAYNVIHRTHIDAAQGAVWAGNNKMADLRARVAAARPGQSFEALGAELPPLDRRMGVFPQGEQNRLYFTALWRVMGTSRDTLPKLKELFGQDISPETAETWANQDRSRVFRLRRDMCAYLRTHPQVTDIRQARREAQIPRNQTTDTQIRQCMREMERMRIVEQAHARHDAGQPYIDLSSPAPVPAVITPVRAERNATFPSSTGMAVANSVAPPTLATTMATTSGTSAAMPTEREPLPDWANDVYQPEHHAPLPDLEALYWPEDFLQ